MMAFNAGDAILRKISSPLQNWKVPEKTAEPPRFCGSSPSSIVENIFIAIFLTLQVTGGGSNL
ncbi:MAG: hypothetical protein R3F53_09940 [Gammaproteobacteria bacterium]